MTLSKNYLLPLLVHLLPLVPLYMERIYLTVATVLLVLLFYTKSKKISVQLEGGAVHDSDRPGLEKSLSRWKRFTFLP